MPSNNTAVVDDVSVKQTKTSASLMNLANIRKAIPETAFKKSLIKSSYFMVKDLSLWLTSVVLIHTLVNSSLWESLSFWQQAIATLVYWNVAGFFMWCLFVIGHDCGHSTFSNYEYVNDIIGHITHGLLLVPFYPWQMSHRRHHMHHNHETKDYSHIWYTPERIKQPDEYLARFFKKNSWMTVVLPFILWPVYVIGPIPDGSHLIPLQDNRLWVDSTSTDRSKCLVSTSVVIAFASIFIYMTGSLSSFLFYYLGPYIMFGWWLVTVTFLQHHSPDTLVYGDEDWKFVTAAFETIDRTYGFGIDHLHHNITDGHVAHHLFFTSIPHYNLPIATQAIRKYLSDNNADSMYTHNNTYDFMLRIFQYIRQYGYKAHKATSADQRLHSILSTVDVAVTATK